MVKRSDSGWLFPASAAEQAPELSAAPPPPPPPPPPSAAAPVLVARRRCVPHAYEFFGFH
ncbi:hypothetical protein DF222_10530 [Corynebacterium yudongzhengii]|uniref:Uncharacterized protein n=1 Tax=Corynebacterium yudongzhengii TaxID=2080740 RepID=A0A2U1T4E7_9CORY|nr:hypothetical protein DF222_10530 [Corynebacterium yudongzhengii]